MKFLYHIFGIDHRFFKNQSLNDSAELVILLSLLLILSFIGFWITFSLTIQSFLPSILLSIAVCAFMLNMYRLIFSISDNELGVQQSKKRMISFILKRSPILIILTLVISSSIQTKFFRSFLEEGIYSYKNQLIEEFTRSVESSTFQEIENIELEYDRARSYLMDIGSEGGLLDQLAREKDASLLYIQEKSIKKINNYKEKIDSSSFFMAQIRILTERNFIMFILVTIILFLLYLSPIYIYISNEPFYEYSRAQKDISRNIIIDEFEKFKNLYKDNFNKSTGLLIEYNSNYEDPPFNSIRKSKEYKLLKKGSLAKWYSEIMQ